MTKIEKSAWLVLDEDSRSSQFAQWINDCIKFKKNNQLHELKIAEGNLFSVMNWAKEYE